ncbi:S-adenosyl-L-methionine-dependent methyltransferase [Aspergillus heteromorphus CBS 117.55]|uniref:S-adenosyl-L-methionine-dependent methyltransferase n=1 Tax=Aspergillus heteromorphus CBS 117.55 TaxID=1448321 RepID=A0A317VCJ7_9EURO|nr:S-adenosyl-L-methionine-dependent methyltransferase [Aspergillus heteromorphus CBS 117.55]PWY71715.1 S-adenosyl-L-methionine-dependent methyltransferase [Aspergillus heteromorphus CBS 117.55]
MAEEIVKLAAIVSQSAEILDRSLKHHGLHMPSFDVDSSVEVPLPSQEVIDARYAATNACMELLDLLQGPLGSGLHTKSGYSCCKYNGSSIQEITRFSIAKYVPLDGEISYDDLSRACGVHVHDLKQIIRFAIAFHRIFAEKRKGYVSHSAGSRKIAEDPLASAGVGMYDDIAMAFTRGFALAHNNEGIFQYLGSRPDKEKQFSDAMQFFATFAPESEPEFLVEKYPWHLLPKGAVVVDVGGSEGRVGRLISRANADIQVIVEDVPGLIERAKAAAAATSENSNVQFKAHDFFSPQPVVADVYLFRWVLHDWSDDNVVRILRQLVPALKTGAKIVVNESLCPENGSLPIATERYIRHIDMTMLAVNNSRLRDEEEWHALFQEADPRFGAIKCWTPPQAALAIMEVAWEG